MADDQNQSNTPTPSESTQAETPRVPAPETPVAGAMTASPLTGGGPHRAEPEKKSAEEHGVKKGPPKPPVSPPKQPPRQPPRPSQGSSEQSPPQSQTGPVTQPVYPQPAAAGPPHPLMMPSGHVHDPAVSSLLAQTLNNQRTQAQKFLLVELPEDDWPRLHEYETIEQLLEGIKTRLGQNCHLFPFLGHKLAITQGPNRFLITPYGPLPLFDIPEPDQVDEAEYGWVGQSLVHPEPPTSDQEDEDEEIEGDEETEDEVVQPELPNAAAEEEDDDTPMFDEEDEPS